ncbi:MAG: hypothetical protein CMJ78_13445 [Planctomycetaceae bacterium]|nr:hypothetical protein [Planctomycetaceae bacterium]
MSLTALLLAAALNQQPLDSNEIPVEKALLTIIDAVTVAPTESGKLTKVSVSEGDIVRKGTLLGQLDDEIERLELQRAATDLDIAKEQAENDVQIRYARKASQVADVELERAKESNDRVNNAVTQTELDSLRLLSEKAKLEIEQAEFEQRTAKLGLKLKANALDAARVKVARRKITSPIAGVVVEINHRAGEAVDTQSNAFRILNTSKLRAEFRLRASMASFSLKGRPVKLLTRIAGNKETEFRGRVVFVSPEINALNGMVRVWAEIDNPDGLLRPGIEVPITIMPDGEATAQRPNSKKEESAR